MGILIPICCFLWYLGGQGHKWCRVVIIPILLGAGVWFTSKSWLCGATTSLFFQVIRVGYGNYEEGEKNSFLGNLTKDHEGYIIRAIVGALYSIGTLPLLFFGVIKYQFIAYLLLNTLIGFYVSKFNKKVLFTDLLVGGGVAIVILL